MINNVSTSGLLLALIFVLMLPACTSNMAIYSRPEGAQVTMDKTKPLGKTPILLKEHAWVWTRHDFTFDKEGYRTKIVKVSTKARPANMVLAVCGSACCLWSVGMLGKLPNDIVVTLEEEDPFEGNVKTSSLVEKPRITFE